MQKKQTQVELAASSTDAKGFLRRKSLILVLTLPEFISISWSTRDHLYFRQSSSIVDYRFVS